MKRLPVVRHLTANRARAKYRACRHPTERTRWHALRLLLRTDGARTPAPPTPARPTRRPAGGGKELPTPGEAAAAGEPGPASRGVGRGRGPARAQADRPPGLVVPGPPAAVVRADPVRVAVRVRLRPA